MRRECRERFPRHRLERKRAVMHVGITNPRWRGRRSQHSGTGTCATRNFTYLARGPWPENNKGIFPATIGTKIVKSRSKPLLLCVYLYTTWWRHNLDTLSVLLVFCAGNPPTGYPPFVGKIRRSPMDSTQRGLVIMQGLVYMFVSQYQAVEQTIGLPMICNDMWRSNNMPNIFRNFLPLAASSIRRTFVVLHPKTYASLGSFSWIYSRPYFRQVGCGEILFSVVSVRCRCVVWSWSRVPDQPGWSKRGLVATERELPGLELQQCSDTDSEMTET